MPVTIKSTGGGSVTMTAVSTASDVTLTLPAVTGTVLQSGTAVTAAQGGTGLTSPGTAGNVLTSDGTTWTSAAPSGGVTSLTAGNGITVSAATGAVTISQDIYTGSSATNTSFPVGTTIIANNFGNTTALATSVTPRVPAGSPTNFGTSGTALTGTWRSRGQITDNGTTFDNIFLLQRTA